MVFAHNYFWKFTHDFTHPLHQRSGKFNWVADVEAACNELKQVLVKAPILGYLSVMILETDTSNCAFSVVLSKLQDGV